MGPRQLVRRCQNIFPVDLVVKQVEALFRFFLRLAVQLPLKRPDLTRCLQAHRPSPPLGFFESAPEVRVLPFPGITRLSRYCDPLRVPVEPPSLRRALKVVSTRTGVPPLAQTTLPACRAHYPGGPEPVRVSVASRSVRPSPFLRRIGIHDFTFEACSGFTRVTAYRVARPPQVAFVTRLRPGPLPLQAACQLPDLPTTIWVGLHPPVICAVGAH